MKSRSKGKWDELFDLDLQQGLELSSELSPEAEEGIVFLEEAHEALNRLNQKANKRGGLMRQPRRAESWD